jgi:hypothetical protein
MESQCHDRVLVITGSQTKDGLETICCRGNVSEPPSCRDAGSHADKIVRHDASAVLAALALNYRENSPPAFAKGRDRRARFTR